MGTLAKKPPMGWNSWDCYGAAVTEEQVRVNAEFMAEHLKAYGWEYVVVDIQWYEPNAVSHEYNKDAELIMDEYGRLMPAPNRFPSAVDGLGFKPLGDYIHSLGLKFGIHILRGIPRQAVRGNVKIEGTDRTAAQIADFGSVCGWNGDMCGIDMAREGAQEYYNSIFRLYSSWGVDFVKADDMARPYRRAEIEAMHRAIAESGRDMALSLSPGDAPLPEAAHLGKYANMWRMTDDFWDNWAQLKKMFDYCRDWSPYVREGHWADCDMMPLGHIRLCDGGRPTNFTRGEQRILMTLWCIFRSPLMFGGDLPSSDSFTLSLLKNRELLKINQSSYGGHELYRRGDEAVWSAYTEDALILAVFNTGETALKTDVRLDFAGIKGAFSAMEIWTGEQITAAKLTAAVPPHDVRIYTVKV